jgi:hypothetical protein
MLCLLDLGILCRWRCDRGDGSETEAGKTSS